MHILVNSVVFPIGNYNRLNWNHSDSRAVTKYNRKTVQKILIYKLFHFSKIIFHLVLLFMKNKSLFMMVSWLTWNFTKNLFNSDRVFMYIIFWIIAHIIKIHFIALEIGTLCSAFWMNQQNAWNYIVFVFHLII